jgi:DnaJ-class molecular chaperone
MGPNPGFNFHSSRSANDIFEEIFGKGFKFAETSDGFHASQEISVRISFEEAARGVQKNVNINVVDECSPCKGSGVSIGHKKVCFLT